MRRSALVISWVNRVNDQNRTWRRRPATTAVLASSSRPDEFRFFVNPDLSCHRIEYWFRDWFDGANRVLSGEDESLLLGLWEWFRETGAAQLKEDAP